MHLLHDFDIVASMEEVTMLMTTRSVAAAGLVALVATAAQAQNPGQDAFRPVVVVGWLTSPPSLRRGGTPTPAPSQ